MESVPVLRVVELEVVEWRQLLRLRLARDRRLPGGLEHLQSCAGYLDLRKHFVCLIFVCLLPAIKAATGQPESARGGSWSRFYDTFLFKIYV
jgi:hypothetical protein